jgi:hypothetical protein
MYNYEFLEKIRLKMATEAGYSEENYHEHYFDVVRDGKDSHRTDYLYEFAELYAAELKNAEIVTEAETITLTPVVTNEGYMESVLAPEITKAIKVALAREFKDMQSYSKTLYLRFLVDYSNEFSAIFELDSDYNNDGPKVHVKYVSVAG